MKEVRDDLEKAKKTDRELHEVNRYIDSAFPVGIYEVTRSGIMPEGRGYKDLHWHEELQFTYVVRGRLNIKIDGNDYIINKDEAVFINRNLLHVTTDLTEDGKYISLNFPDKLLGFFSGSRMEQDYVLPYTRGYGVPATRSYIRKQERIRQMLTYIHDHYMEEVHLKDIAKATSVSIGECCRCFQSMVGITPNQYLMKYRIEKSKEFLIGTEMTVTEVAYATGFSDSSYFIQCFRKYEGITPGEYGKC